ncbi:SpvB/TcaC N-terminal domain-containing protein [Sphingobacterium sp. UME9]|uniref:SpvB/TcaC N-terminal domain-containing protein n=1 Tax=Sphingobacterium sp. UME9 TaxID=1862316 RepID=UPI001601F391|nr:SpvB/TcaC N-terminal domain-containing protein [Sphingobacterium sp. UME9]MBB1642974.1 hypothetical protein [Sphingobacterium sp. UME9]
MSSSEKITSEATKVSAKEIVFPKGGGAIKGLGDSFKTNLFSGAGTYAIPVPITPARGFEPQLSLSYSSGSGNGVFGMGFSLSLSKISVSTNKGIPRYDGTDSYELDGEPLLVQQSSQLVPNPRNDHYQGHNYQVTLYLSQIENTFSQIEHWQGEEKDSNLSFWKLITAENTASYYGTKNRITNPDDPSQIFEWLIDESTDNKGNLILYSYVAENALNVPDQPYEVNRNNKANRYIDRISYGNYRDADKDIQFAFQVVFNYGQLDGQESQAGWSCRPDPFSLYNSGFEIRTYRLCESIHMVHYFPEELGDPLIVKELSFNYEHIQQYTPVLFHGMSMLTKATLKGFRKELTEPQILPPLEFNYSTFNPPLTPTFKTLDMGENSIPGYLNPTHFLPVDLNGDGLPGFLISDDEMSLYLAPLGEGKYTMPQANASFPLNRNIQQGNSILTDLDGNGQLELVISNEVISGFYARAQDNGWDNFVPFESYPTCISSSEMELTDLSATGKNDLVLPGTNQIQYYPSEGKKGYGPARDTPNDNNFPPVKPNYTKELVTFANIFGDGLSHRVKISSGKVECWPCLGYGQFGKKIILGNAPIFDKNFDTKRLFLTDIDGSGTTDLVYVYPDRVELFINQSGNSFSAPLIVYLPELFDITDQISFADILGNGTNCLVFTKMNTTPKHYYYNFSGGSATNGEEQKSVLKPYLLYKIDNNMGMVNYIKYCSSTKFLLEDKQKGKPWVTSLPFPIQVVEELIQYEALSKSRYVTRYQYHDGYYDTDQKKFKGFGFIESWDTESYEEFQSGYHNPDYTVAELNRELFIPPVYTKTWYLNGATGLVYELLLTKYQNEYYSQDTEARSLPNSVLSPDIYSSSEKTFSEAYKAMASKVLRTEIYALDETAASAAPYSVEESNYSVVLIQPATENQEAAFLVNSRESITYQYERDHTDPRVQQHFVLQTDPLNGQPLKSCTIYLPRRQAHTPHYPEQYLCKAIIETFNYYNTPASEFNIRLRAIEYQRQAFELLNINTSPSGYFSFEMIDLAVQSGLQNIVPYLAAPSTGLQAQQYSRVISYFCDSDTGMALPFGIVSPQILLHHISTAEFTNDNITAMFGQRLTRDTIEQFGGYIYDEVSGYWENPGLTQHYAGAEGFYMTCGTSSDLGIKNTISYDNYYLVPLSAAMYVSILPPITNVITAVMDYQAMAPRQLVDMNGTVHQALFDALGQVVVTSIFGTENNLQTGGMRLYEYNGNPAEYQPRTVAPDGKPVDFNSIIKDLKNKEYYLQGASAYFYYDLNAYMKQQQPVNSIHLQRNHYAMENDLFSCQTAIAYNDGMGRSLAAKTEVESTTLNSRWLVSGRSVYNNKGKVCENYLSYFSDTPFYQTQEEITRLYQVPPPTITHYDPLSRVIRIDTPKGFFSKIEFSPWERFDFDEDDTVKDAVYYKNFMAAYPEQPTRAQAEEKKALEMAADFYGTYTTSVMDNMGNVIRTVQLLNEQNNMRSLVTFFSFDIQGRKTVETDPRLYADNINQGKTYYNFKYQYGMGAEQPMVTDSADAGLLKHFSTIFGKLVWSLSAREYCQVLLYDGLQRKTQVLVKKVPGTGPITGFDDFNLVEQFIYGETEGAAAGHNLRGQLYILKDLSGILINSSYSMLGNVLQSSRQMTSMYKSAVNWHDTVPLETNSCVKTYVYNSLNLLLSETIKDHDQEWNTTINTYNLEGLLNSISVNTNGVKTPIIKNINYDANRQRTKVLYGNNVITTYRYEPSTLNLLQIFTNSGSNQVQNINYTYDPVGNVTCAFDTSIETIFNNNQKIDPVFDHQYDSLYRLIQASGRQHKGINANTNMPAFSQSPINDGQAIENYTELYSYDDSGNLIKKQHVTLSSAWTTETGVLQNCNRLQGLEYDASGNQRQLTINNGTVLNYNCCENLVSAKIIARADFSDDADYYVYDKQEQRTRKVYEQYLNSNSVNYTDTIYFDNYEHQRKGVQTTDGTRTIAIDRQTLRIMDKDTCVAIIYHWKKGGPDSTAAIPASDQLRYQMDNSLGSVSVELDETGMLVTYEEYFPYGGTSFIAGPNQVDVALKIYRYSGKERDNSTGLYYFGMRYYLPWFGRWLKPDPAGTVDGLNLYTFVAGNPVSNTDKTGLMLRTIATKVNPFKMRDVPKRYYHIVVGSGKADKMELPTVIKYPSKIFDNKVDSTVIHTDYYSTTTSPATPTYTVKNSSAPVDHHYIVEPFDVTKLHDPKTMSMFKSIEKQTGTPLEGIIWSFPRSAEATKAKDLALIRNLVESYRSSPIDVPLYISTTEAHPTLPPLVLAAEFEKAGISTKIKTLQPNKKGERTTFSNDGTKSLKISYSKIVTTIASKKTSQPL